MSVKYVIMKLTAVIFALCINWVAAIIGYDCGSNQLKVNTFWLLDVGKCEIKSDNINTTTSYIQLLQVNEYKETIVKQCKIEYHRTVYHCGMFSHISIVRDGENDYIKEVTREECERIHETKVFRPTDRKELHDLSINKTTTRGILFAGDLAADGKCSGVYYSDPFGSWFEVVVQGTVRVTLIQQTARINLETNTLHLRSGVSCPMNSGNCIDHEGGYTFWNVLPTDSCKFNKYSILYKGIANKIVDLSPEESQTVYSVDAGEMTFSLATTGREKVCGYKILTTEHPKLFIFETDATTTFALNDNAVASNLNIFNYINSKFVYVEKHIKKQLKTLYVDIMKHKCELERQTMKNALSFATQAPDEFAYDVMKGEGYMAVTAGEVVHVIKCLPVQVVISHGSKCFAELEVQRNNKTFFLRPRTHVLKSTGTEVPCNTIIPQHFFINNQWIKILPYPMEAQSPKILNPSANLTWHYENINDLAKTGIYTEENLQVLRDRIMFPVERPSLLNDVARELGGHTLEGGQGTIFKLLTDNTLEKIIDSTWNKIWSRLISFGTVSAGLIAIFTIIRFVKSVLDVVLQGYALHSIYGWSIHLVGALFSSVTHFLINMSTTESCTTNTQANTSDKEIILKDNTMSNSTSSHMNDCVIEVEPSAPSELVLFKKNPFL